MSSPRTVPFLFRRGASRGLSAGLALGALLLVAASSACTGPKTAAETEQPPVLVDVQAGPAVILGTVMDANSSAPVAGALVIAPDGSQATTDVEGRFKLKGLPLGTVGLLEASAGDLSGSVQLRPLGGGRLEVVLFLR